MLLTGRINTVYTPTMNKGTPESAERNQALYNDYKTGMEYVDLVAKYRISSQRVWQIIKRIEKKEQNGKH